MNPERPEKKRGGYDGPRSGYPKDQESYADPENWKYPVHTPFHARAARRYFNTPRNRAKYTPEEQAYIDARIDAALEKFGIAVKMKGGVREMEEGIIEEDIPTPKNIEALSRDELLKLFLGAARFDRAHKIPDDAVDLDRLGEGQWVGEVKGYEVEIDFPGQAISHNCADWRSSRAKARLFCKHVGKAFLSIPEADAAPLLRTLLKTRDVWSFA